MRYSGLLWCILDIVSIVFKQYPCSICCGIPGAHVYAGGMNVGIAYGVRCSLIFVRFCRSFLCCCRHGRQALACLYSRSTLGT